MNAKNTINPAARELTAKELKNVVAGGLKEIPGGAKRIPRAKKFPTHARKMPGT
jgi:hypothetical protein